MAEHKTAADRAEDAEIARQTRAAEAAQEARMSTDKHDDKKAADEPKPVKKVSTLSATFSKVAAKRKADEAKAKEQTEEQELSLVTAVVGDRLSYDQVTLLDPVQHETLTNALGRDQLRLVDDGSGWLVVKAEVPAFVQPNAMGV
jgi:hypothetical protein